MTPERWRLIDKILDRVLECEPHERAALLDECCAGDAELRGEVEALLAAHERAPGFIEKPPLTEMQAVLAEEPEGINSPPTRSERIGLTFGHYQIKSSPATTLPALSPTVSNVTAPGRIISTFGYMSPEQVRGEAVDTPSDIFAFGCVLYEMLFGQRLFTRATTAETMAAILRDEPLLRVGKEVAVPDALQRLLLRCLAQHPADRYQSARDLAFDVQAMLAGTKASSPSRLHVSRRSFAFIVVTLLLGIVAWVGSAWWKRNDAINSLAVLPLMSVAPDPEIDSLAEGVIEGVITHLSQIPDLRVMARSTVFRLKAQAIDPQQAGQQLKVKAVLTRGVSLAKALPS